MKKILNRPSQTSDKPILTINNNIIQNTINNNNNNSKEIELKKDINNIKLSEPDEPIIPEERRNLIFKIFLLSNLFLNYDTGVIPASLIEITKEISLNYSEQALIGSLVYLGLSFSSIFVGLIFTKFSPSKICSFILFLNCISCFVFSFSSDKLTLFAMRFLMGATEAFIVIYGPVWVNNFSPVEHSATWMGILHSCSIFGVFFGYLASSIIINFFNKIISWRFAIQIQGFVVIFLALFFWAEKDEYINIDIRKKIPLKEIELDAKDINVRKNSADSPNIPPPSQIYHKTSKRHDPRIDSIELGNLSRYFMQAKTVLSTKLYLYITLAMSSIYFIVTGIQFWITKYLIEILNTKPIIVNVIFSIISITAPLSGVLFGGTFSDRYGGYKGKNETKALQMCTALGILAFCFSLPMGFIFQITYLSALLWSFLFFGAAIIPIATGIMISCVPKDCQATSSSISQLIFNLFGYFSAPMITGFIMDRFNDEKLGFIWGMRVVFFSSSFAIIFIAASYFVSYGNYRRNVFGETEGSSMIDDSMKDNFSEFMKIEINRRMVQQGSLI